MGTSLCRPIGSVAICGFPPGNFSNISLPSMQKSSSLRLKTVAWCGGSALINAQNQLVGFSSKQKQELLAETYKFIQVAMLSVAGYAEAKSASLEVASGGA